MNKIIRALIITVVFAGIVPHTALALGTYPYSSPIDSWTYAVDNTTQTFNASINWSAYTPNYILEFAYSLDGGAPVPWTWTYSATSGITPFSIAPSIGNHTIAIWTFLSVSSVIYYGSTPAVPFTIIDPNAPTMPTITGPTTGDPGVNQSFSIVSTSPSSDTIKYGIDWDNNSTVDEWVPTSGYAASGIAQTAIHQWPSVAAYIFQVKAVDSHGRYSPWRQHFIRIGWPSLPTITGPNTGILNTNYTYSFVSTTSLGATVKYGIDWTGTMATDFWLPNTGYVASGIPQATSTFTWANTGSGIAIRATAMDSNGRSSLATKFISIKDPPTPPIITGSVQVAAGTNNDYSFVSTTTVQPQKGKADNIIYQVDWDNNGTVDSTIPTTGNVVSGLAQTASKNWVTPGVYTFQIRAQNAKDNSLSAWSPYTVDVKDPSACDVNMGNTCGTSAPNMCGMTSQATIQCDGTCGVAAPPSDALCSIPVATIFEPNSDTFVLAGIPVALRGEGFDWVANSSTTVQRWSDNATCVSPTFSNLASTTRIFGVAGTYDVSFRVRNNAATWSTNCPSVRINVCNTNFNTACISAPNTCGMTNGLRGCFGGCTAPSDTLCPATFVAPKTHYMQF